MFSKMLNNIQNVKSGSIKVIQIIQERLAILEEQNPKVNAIVEYYPQLLLEQAKELDGKIENGFQGKLCGVIVTVKDNLEVEGFKATAGMLRFKENVSKGDCTIVRMLRKEGALIIGKTNLPAGAMDVQTDNKVYGRTNHPSFMNRTCGGSSGGGACSVAIGISDIDIGNDFMGSIRIPAHFCGIYGLVATDDTIPLEKIIGGKPYGSTMSKILRSGLQASSLFDLEYVFQIISKAEKVLVPKVLQSKLMIAYTTSAGGLILSEEYAQAYHKYREKLSHEHNLVEIKDKDFDFEKARECFLKLLYANIAITLPPVLRFLARTIGGKQFMVTNLKHYLETEDIREKCIEELEKLLCYFDVLLSPVCSLAAFEHQTPIKMQGEQAVYSDLKINDEMVPYAAATMGFTTPFSLTSSPVITIPIGKNSIGLPMGLQVVGKRNREYDLLQSAKELCKYKA